MKNVIRTLISLLVYKIYEAPLSARDCVTHWKLRVKKTTVSATKKLGIQWPQILEVPTNYVYQEWKVSDFLPEDNCTGKNTSSCGISGRLREVRARILHQNNNDPISTGEDWVVEWGLWVWVQCVGFIAPDKLGTEEVLEYLRRSLGKKPRFFLLFSKSLQWLSPGKKLGYLHFIMLIKRGLWY